MKKSKKEKSSKSKSKKKGSKKSSGRSTALVAISENSKPKVKRLSAEDLEQAWMCYQQTQGNVSQAAKLAGVNRNTMARYANKGDSKKGIIPFSIRFSDLKKKEDKKNDRDAFKMRDESLAMLKNVKSKVAAGLNVVKEFKFNKSSALEITRLIEMITRMEQTLMGEMQDLVKATGQKEEGVKLPPHVLEKMAKVALDHMLEEQGTVEDAEFTPVDGDTKTDEAK